jgi:hypothetical protein
MHPEQRRGTGLEVHVRRILGHGRGQQFMQD